MEANDVKLDSQATVLQVSDTHLSQDYPPTDAMWTALIRYAERTRPDLVIHTGDVIHDDPDSDRDYEYAAFQLRRLTTAWRMVPGNHDIGDSEPDPYHGPVTQQRLDRYRTFFGDDRWTVGIGGWQLIGLNSQLFDNHLTEEDTAQWDWLDRQIAHAAGRPVALFFHKPPFINSLDEEMFVNKSVGLQARARIAGYVKAGQVNLIGSGHLHEYVTVQSGGAMLVGAPSLGMAPPGSPKWGLGLRCNGIVEYRFRPDSVRFRLLQPHDLGIDIKLLQ